MKYREVNSIPSFETVRSVTAKFGSYILSFFILIPIILFFILFLFSLTDDFFDGVLIFVEITIIVIVILAFYSWRKKMYTTVIIDENGIHYFNEFSKKIIKEFLWNNFESIEKYEGSFYFLDLPYDSDCLKYDVISKTKISNAGVNESIYWFVLLDGKVQLIDERFNGNHIFSLFYSNRLELIRSLILGFTHFRPDLKLHPLLFKKYYINPNSFVIEYENRASDRETAFLIVMMITIIVFFIMVFIYF